MKETQAVALQKLGEIVELGADKAVVAALTENVKNIDEMIKSLGSAARERLELAAQHEKLYDAVRKAQRRFVAAAGPAVIDAQTELYSIYARRQLLAGRSHPGAQDRRPARRHRRQRQSHGVRHDRRAFDQQQRTYSKRSAGNSAPRRRA